MQAHVKDNFQPLNGFEGVLSASWFQSATFDREYHAIVDYGHDSQFYVRSKPTYSLESEACYIAITGFLIHLNIRTVIKMATAVAHPVLKCIVENSL